jgi:glucose-1-phosphate thymidylyltransferase
MSRTEKIQGIVLAGGLGRRLGSLTKITNKHLLPVWDRPMVFYPLQSLVEAGIDEIVLVVGGQHPGEFLRLLGDGKLLGIKKLAYAYQEGQGGIAEALGCARNFCGSHRVCVILGDNIFEKSLRPYAAKFARQSSGARLLLKKVTYPERFGVPVFDGRRIKKIVEKPKRPPSPYAVTGAYFYDSGVFDIIAGLNPSRRGELEITDVSNEYIKRGDLAYDILPGWWTDAGTIPTLHAAAQLAAKTWRNMRGYSELELMRLPNESWIEHSQRRLFAPPAGRKRKATRK